MSTVKTFFAAGADELLEEKMYKFDKSQQFTHGLIRFFNTFSTVTEPEPYFTKDHAKSLSSVTRNVEAAWVWKDPSKRKLRRRYHWLVAYSNHLRRVRKVETKRRRKVLLLITNSKPRIAICAAQADIPTITKPAGRWKTRRSINSQACKHSLHHWNNFTAYVCESRLDSTTDTYLAGWTNWQKKWTFRWKLPPSRRQILSPQFLS